MPAPDMFWLTLQWPNRWSHDTFERTNRTEGIVSYYDYKPSYGICFKLFLYFKNYF
jgi:hypothetical protein